jgi:hypothetical protein
LKTERVQDTAVTVVKMNARSEEIGRELKSGSVWQLGVKRVASACCPCAKL